MGLRKPTAAEFIVVGIVGLIGAMVQVALSHVAWGASIGLIAVGMFWRAWRLKLSS